MAATCMEAVIKKMPMNWGHIIGNGQFKKCIGDNDQMSSLFKSVAENREVLKRPLWLTHHPIIAPLIGSHGLSARRARRMKSCRPEGPKAGLKGCELEIGAWRDF